MHLKNSMNITESLKRYAFKMKFDTNDVYEITN